MWCQLIAKTLVGLKQILYIVGLVVLHPKEFLAVKKRLKKKDLESLGPIQRKVKVNI